MSPEKSSKPTKLCPTCGTRISEDAARCLVCGADLSSIEQSQNQASYETKSRQKQPSSKTGSSAPLYSAAASRVVQGSRMPEVTLTLPAVIGLFTLFLAAGALLVYFAMKQFSSQPTAVAQASVTSTATLTPSPTISPTPFTPTPTFTPLPTPTPIQYTIKLGDSCLGIALAFKVSVQSIVLANPELSADCGNVFEGQKLKIPQPTPTATPLPTATLNSQEATEAACPKVEHIVKQNETLGGIALNYNVSAEAIKEYNGLVSDFVRFDQKLVIPLCRRNATPGPTPTPTLPPPYPAPNLLLPPDGAPFALTDETIPLQWASVGALRANEAYAVTVEDITEGQGRKIVEYVVDTKFIVPVTFRPQDNKPHALRWWVLTVRQVGTDTEGKPIWEPAGAVSVQRVFIWVGAPTGAPASTATPKP